MTSTRRASVGRHEGSLMFGIGSRSLALGVAVVAVVAFARAGAAYARQASNSYTVAPLVSDSSATPAASTDPSLVNGWG